MSLFTMVYFDDNVNTDTLYDVLEEITQVKKDSRENIDSETQTITRSTQFTSEPQRPGILMTCAIIGKLIPDNIYHANGDIDEPECWVEVEFYTRGSVLAPVETHVSYLMALEARGYSFQWKNPYDEKIYDGKNFEALVDFCTMGEAHYRK